jgi:glycosyltransferase involved in cell wall biosynthesis
MTCVNVSERGNELPDGIVCSLNATTGAENGCISQIPGEIDRIQRLAREQPDLPIAWSIPTVVAVGRLTEQKGFGYLLQAFAAVARQRSLQLLILGEGG